MSSKFIKVVNRELAENLASRGFQYIREQTFYVFAYSEELLSVLRQNFSEHKYFCENKLRF